jgi:hypothetical protein
LITYKGEAPLKKSTFVAFLVLGPDQRFEISRKFLPPKGPRKRQFFLTPSPIKTYSHRKSCFSRYPPSNISILERAKYFLSPYVA